MKTFIKILLVCIVLLIFIPLAAATYFGLIPYLSPLLGFNQPQNLGVTYTEVDRASAYTKNAVASVALSDSTSIKNSLHYEGKKEIDTFFTSAEITALINSNKWKYMPISQIQIRINPDGSGEASGVLHTDRLLPYIALSVPAAEIKSFMEKYHFPSNPTFYVKGFVSVSNNKVSLNPQIVKIGPFVVPTHLITPNISAATSFAENRIQSVPNLNIKSLDLSGSKINLSATVPEKEYSAQ